MSETNECPHLIEVHRLWEGELEARRAGQARRHLADCSLCRAEYESWDRLSRLLTRGDPATPLVSERQRLLKEKLLGECAASLAEAPDAAHRRSAVWPWGQRWWMPARIAVALAPLAAALLLLLYAARTVPPGGPRPTQVDAAPAPPLPRPKPAVPQPGTTRKVPPRAPVIVRTPEPTKEPVRPRPKLSRPERKQPRSAVRAYRVVRGIRPAPVPQDRRPEPMPRRTVVVELPRDPATAIESGDGARTAGGELVRSSSGPASESRSKLPHSKAGDPARAPGVAAPKPIERIVIQVDEPPRAVETRTITHVTVIAKGDPTAPGAELTVVRSQREENIP